MNKNTDFFCAAIFGIVLMGLPFSSTWSPLVYLFLLTVLILYVMALNTRARQQLFKQPALGLCLFTLAAALVFFPLNSSGIVVARDLAIGLLSVAVFRSLSGKIQHIFILLIICTITFHGLWGATQFVLQNDLGLYLLGETQLVSGQAGLATFSTAKLFRAYGPYPHPNILGGLCVIVLMILTVRPQLLNHVPLRMLTLSLWLSILLTFSRSAWLGGALALVILIARKSIPLSVRQQLAFWLVLLTVSLSPLLYLRLTDSADAAMPERLSGYAHATDIIRDNGLVSGTGLGNYVPALTQRLQQLSIAVAPWELAPVHSVPLLLLSEWSIGLTILFLLGIGLTFWNLLRFHWPFLLPLLPLLVLDHYFYTNSAATILLFSILALLSTLPDYGRAARISTTTRRSSSGA